MKSTARARLRLSLLVEPGDPRVQELLAEASVESTLDRAISGDPTVPESWTQRAADLDRREEGVRGRADRAGLTWVTPGSVDWPTAVDDLDECQPLSGSGGAPLGLWAKGSGRLATLMQHAVGVVGARQCTTYGAETAGDLAADCADAGVTVVSGAAFGIDACAHRGAIVGGSPTVAVLACGADLDYPSAHAALLERIAEDGLVVTEQAPGERVQRQRFLSRNRIIAALSDGVVVVEAARRSGSLNTLHWADRLSRTTMAVPGPVTSQQSVGCHTAVREGEAVLVTTGADILAETYGIEPDQRVGGLPVVARRIWAALGTRGITVETLATAQRLSPREVLRGLSLLRAKGVVSSDEQDRWQRVA